MKNLSFKLFRMPVKAGITVAVLSVVALGTIKGQQYTIEQSLSDKAQSTTIAFDGLAFVTGDLGSDSFFPPGKVADFWGFQYLRDNDPTQMGHNTSFLTSAALNMLNVLTVTQRQQLIALATSQVAQINEYGYLRFVLMKAFRRLPEGDVPIGTTGLSPDAVKAFSSDLYELDGVISYARAQVMGNLLYSLTAEQKAYLDAMVGQGMLNWPVVEEPADLRGLGRDQKVAVMTYAGDMFSWYAGSVDADVYFCPERQGTYFGSFYLKDAPAMGNPDYTIPTDLTGSYGSEFIANLTAGQSALITGLVDQQRPFLYEIVDRRRDVSVLLRNFMTGGSADYGQVISLMARYGELDGEIIYRFATAFAAVKKTLSTAQMESFMSMRTELLGDLHPDGAYLYSQPIAMPDIANTDFLFAVVPEAPTGPASQIFCSGSVPTVASLSATGTAIKWYAAASGGTALSAATALVNGSHYYASQTVAGSESTSRLDVTVTVTPSPGAPTGAATKTFCSGTALTLANLPAKGTAIKWYALPTGGTPMDLSTPLVNGVHYYASQTVNGCESVARLDVTAIINPLLTASVSITVSANPVVSGTSVTFTAKPINGGTAPVYRWYRGTRQVGTNSAVYSYVPANGDVITVKMTSNATPCLTGSPATSNAITMTVTRRKSLVTGSELSDEAAPSINLASETLNPAGTSLEVWPNPAGSCLNIRYTIDREQPVIIQFIDFAGRIADELQLGNQEKGEHLSTWDTGSLNPGTYFVQLKYDRTAFKRLVILR